MLMRHLNVFGKLLAIGLLTTLFASCHDEVDMDFRLTCNNDLLEFVVPTVEYVDVDGNPQTITIEATMWKDGTDNQKVWEKNLHFKSFGVTRQMTVKYASKEGVEKSKEVYTFVHQLICDVKTDDGHVTVHNITSVQTGISTSVVQKDIVDNYINSLINTPDVCYVEVDEDGKVKQSSEPHIGM